jgi:ATP-binding cassette subfamily B protein
MAMVKPATAIQEIGVWSGLREIYAHISGRRRRELAAVLALMLFGALAELATIGSIIPFLSFLSQGTSPRPGIFAIIGGFFGGGAIVGAAIIFGAVAIVAGVIRLELTWVTQHFAFRLGHELALESRRRILLQPYSFHIGHNSSELVTATEKAELLVFDLILPSMQAATAGFIATVLVLGLLYIDPSTTIAASAAFFTIYLAVAALTAKRLASNSAIVGTAHEERLKILQEGLGGIRDIIIDNSQPIHLSLFDRVNTRLGRARATTNFIAQAPRFIIESVGMVIIAAIVLLASKRSGGIAVALPLLGAFAVGAQRLLPLVQTVYTGWSVAAGHRSIVAQMVEILRLRVPQHPAAGSPLPHKARIKIEDVSFSYPGRPETLSRVTFDIPKGAMIALTGKTGAGKSTLADLLMGLLEPTAGQIRIDGVALTPTNAGNWQRNIAHVPQSIFLPDTTIARNIALALADEPLDLDRIVDSARQAQLDDFVKTLARGYDTRVGEGGVRLSGGQRQRLGLARAIYKQAPVLVLDEATSALDYETEAAVIHALEDLRQLGHTIIIIAHRLSALRHCDTIVRLEDGRVVEIATGGDLIRGTSRIRDDDGLSIAR